jgi:hypothetical protein
VRLGDDGARGRIEIGRVIRDRIDHEAFADELMHAIGRDQKDVAGIQARELVVDLQVRVHAERAAQVTLLLRDPQAVVGGELLQRGVTHAINARVAGVEQVRGGRLQHQRAEGADVAPVLLMRLGTLAGLRVQPGIHRHQHALRRFLHRPGRRSAVVILEEAAHRGLAGHLAHGAAADAVGQRQRDALRRELRFPGNAGAVEILVDLLAPLVGMLPQRDSELLGHDVRQEVVSGRGSGVRQGLSRVSSLAASYSVSR